MDKNVVLTFDLDWAPDWMVASIREILIENRVKSTWFITHESEELQRLAQYKDLFELGIHPNLHEDSSHGNTEEEVLYYMKTLVPDAVSMRTHGLWQSTNFLNKACCNFDIKIDSSIFIPRGQNLQPFPLHFEEGILWRVPYFWEDDSEMLVESPCWDCRYQFHCNHGLKVFDFHPVHIALNTTDLNFYKELKKLRPLPEWDREFLEPFRKAGKGPMTLFLDLVNALKHKAKKLNEVVEVA